CSSVSGTVTIANCDGLNTSDDDSDVILAKNAVLGAVLSDIIFDGSVDSVSVTFRHSGEAGIGGTVGITFYDGLNLAAFCSEDTSISNASSFTTSEVVSCTPVGGWDYAKLDNLQLRVQNKDTGSPDDAYLSYLMVAVEYTPTVSGGDGGTGGCGVGCCGGGTCDAETGEDYWTCRTDCSGPAVMVITLLSPMPEQEFGGGDTVLIQATVDADSQNQVAVKDFMIEGKFGLIELFDDGKHNDEMAGDRVYGNSFMVEDENTTIFQPLTLSATLGERTVVVQEGYQVVPVLALNIGSNKNTYSLGDLIQLNGLIKRQGVPLEQEIHLVLSGGGTILLEEFLTSDSQGAFSISYPTTTVDPEGEWTVFAEAMDEAGNYGFFEKTIRVFESQAFVELQIELLTGIDTFFERGETKKLLVRLLDQYGELVENARVEWVSPLGETFVFTAEKGQYALSYLFPHDLEAGVQLFQIRAQKETEYSTQQGLEEIELQISETPLIITVLEPVDFSVQVGEAIDFTIQVSYSSGALVEQASFSGSINGKPVFFSALEKGVYVASYAVQPEDQGRPSFSLIVTDEFQNQGIVELDFAVSGVSPLHFVRENAWLLAIVVGISEIMFLGGYHANFFRRKKDVLVKRKQVLESKIAENQKQYYKLNIITRATYTKLHSQYSLELERIAKELEKAEEEKK
ncbi:hypothetical protein KKE06_02355, partial [Candidatus Micrarchaeota archaeon]|nr:hypothetical protein [Candidatus Micrarchaeota archaeon]